MRKLGKMALSLMALLMSVGASHAQSSLNPGAPLFYDLAQETTLVGTVAEVFTKAAPHMLPGAHLTLTTPAGSVDVILSAFAFAGKGSLPILQGQQVEVTGISKTWHGGPVFFSRLVRVGGNVYVIRNSRGLPIGPKSHEGANQEAENGETR